MADRSPIALYDGHLGELRAGDTLRVAMVCAADGGGAAVGMAHVTVDGGRAYPVQAACEGCPLGWVDGGVAGSLYGGVRPLDGGVH
jgi:hypothetical protein